MLEANGNKGHDREPNPQQFAAGFFSPVAEPQRQADKPITTDTWHKGL